MSEKVRLAKKSDNANTNQQIGCKEEKNENVFSFDMSHRYFILKLK